MEALTLENSDARGYKQTLKTHNMRKKSKLNNYKTVDQEQIKLFALFLQKLAKIYNSFVALLRNKLNLQKGKHHKADNKFRLD